MISAPSQFVIEVGNDDFETHLADIIPECDANLDWNAYFCDNFDDFGILQFESDDEDAESRAL